MEPRRPHADPHRHPRFDSTDRKTIDNSSSATLNEDTHRQQQKNSVNWKLSKDGRYWLAELVLHKDFLPDGRSYEKLGMKVVGGQKLDRTRVLRAIVQDIREGSLAHHVGHIRPGDEVLEWNGTLLRGKSKETVANIIALSKNDSHVRLVLTRRFGNTPPPLDRSEFRRSLPPYMEVHPESLQRDPRYLKYLDGRTNHSPAKSPERSSIGGRIQVGLWYDQQTYQLIVTVVCAKDLLPRPDMSRRNTYIKVVLLPDNSKENKRRSKAIADTNDPQFNQTFFFHHLRQTELRRKALQISAWDYDRRNAFSDFLGEVVISLQAASSNELPQWYNLSFHTDGDKACPGIMPMSMTGRTSDEGVFPQKQKFCAHTERRIMAVDCSSRSYEKDGRQQNGLPIGITPTSPQYFPMSERSRPLATASPMVEYPRHRSREGGFENRRRTQFIADPASRRTPDYSSRSLSPPEMRPQIQPMPRPSNAHHGLPQPKNVLKKQQLPQVPIPLSDGYHQFLKTRNSAGATASERRIMAVECSSPSYENDGRQQTGLPMGITPTSPQYSPMSELTRPLATASPMVEYPRHRSREAGFEDRRRTQFIADPTSRRTPDYSSRSLSPPEMRLQIQPMPRPSNAHHDLPQPKNVLKKQQLPQVPIPLSDGYHQFLKTRNSAGATASGGYSEYDRSVQCRGGESRMAAAPGAGTSRPPVGPERGDSERSLSSASHSRSRTIGEFTSRSPAYGGPVHPSSREIDRSLSHTVVGFSTDPEAVILRSTLENSDAERSSRISKKSSSTSQLSVTGLLPKKYKRNFFFWRRNGSSLPFVVRRSEEILADVRANSSISSDGSISGDSLTRGPRLPPEVAEASSFVENLGPGQVVGRQALVSLSLGDVELRICRRKKELEVDVIRARGLKAELGSKSSLPDSYVEICLMNSQKSIAKKKTATARKTLDPLYQQQLVFPYDCQNCYLQVMVWGNYDGMKQPKFMGVAQIPLDDIHLEKDVIASYKLFHHFSLVN